MNFYEKVKHALDGVIQNTTNLLTHFVHNPDTDFKRSRKLDFATTIRILISMGASNIKKELFEFFNYSLDTATTSAFCQQRSKILPEAFSFIFQEFNNCFPIYKTYRGFRLIACDGSVLNIARNPSDETTHITSSSSSKGFNELHLNALYDLCSKRYIDAIIQPCRKKNEYSAMADMVDRCTSGTNTIFIADRGYESYNIFAHVQEKNMYFLIRVKESKGSMVSSFDLPKTESFDTNIHLNLSRKQTALAKESLGYKFIPSNSNFNYLDENDFYHLALRVVRFPITADTYECVITNLPTDTFPPEELKKLYGMRWGIETSFRELKYDIGLNYFHSKKVENIKQEIFARLILYNFCEIITTHVVIKQKDTKYKYQVNYTIAIHICQQFLRSHTNIYPPIIETMILQNLLPIRPGRSDPRKAKPKSSVSFLYRIS